MRDVFQCIDAWDSKLNVFVSQRHFRTALLFVSLVALFLWALFGFDSGLNSVGNLLSNLSAFVNGNMTFSQWWSTAFMGYGISGHWSTITTYGFLAVGLSWLLEKMGIVKSKNIILSIILLYVNIGLFEHWYRLSIGVFHTIDYMIAGYTQEAAFAMYFILVIPIVPLASLYFYAETYDGNGKRTFKFQPSKWLWISIAALIASVLLWYFYPFPYQQVGGRFFPQTSYSFPVIKYVPNDGVHFMNVLVKALFAFVQFHILYHFKRCEL